MTSEQLAARNAAIKKAWDDPLRRALLSAKKMKPGSKLLLSRKEYNAWYRKYRSAHGYNSYHRDYRKRKKLSGGRSTSRILDGAAESSGTVV